MTPIFSLLLLSLLSFSCTKESNVIEPASPDKPATAGNTINKSLMLQLVNEARSKGCQCGDTYYPAAPSLLWNDQLATAAFTHSNDMYENDYFSHTALDGSNGGIRIQRAGYAWRTYGENIAMGYRTEKEVVDGWLQSPGHCKNIMNKSFKEVGVARVGTYWTQEFGTK